MAIGCICYKATQPPQEDAAQPTQPTPKKARKTAPGRDAGGLACIGCRHYTPEQPQLWRFNGTGWCQARSIEVQSRRRYACPQYEFHATPSDPLP